MRFHNVSAESSWIQAKGWERRLALCEELSRSQSGPQRRLKNSPAITALAVSRCANNPLPPPFPSPPTTQGEKDLHHAIYISPCKRYSSVSCC